MQISTTMIAVLCLAATALNAADACSQAGAYLDMTALVQKADVVVGGLYKSQTVISQRKQANAYIQLVVDSTFKIESVYRRSAALAGVCLPETITIRSVVLVSGCVDFRPYWRVGQKYVAALKYQGSGAFTLLDQTQLCTWSLTNGNDADVRGAPCAAGQVCSPTRPSGTC